MTRLVVRTDRDAVAELRLNRPDSRNALSTSLLVELRDHLAAVAADRSVRAVLLSGSGPAFCAGADLHEFRAAAPASRLAPPSGPQPLGAPQPPGSPQPPRSAPSPSPLGRIRLVVEVLRRLGELEQPTLAAVHGPAIGAGWGLALACDLCFAADEATFSLPEVPKGLRLPAPLVSRLAQIVGPVRTAEIIFGGGTYHAEDAVRWGWATRVLPTPEALAEEARTFCAALASRPRRAIISAKHPLRQLAPTAPFPPLELFWTEE